jgi:hypothetical protein
MPSCLTLQKPSFTTIAQDALGPGRPRTPRRSDCRSRRVPRAREKATRAVNPANTGKLNFTCRDILKAIQQQQLRGSQSLANWWIYFGTIRPKKIDLDMTAGLALPGIDLMIEQATEAGDADRLASMTAIRDKLVTLDPGRVHCFPNCPPLRPRPHTSQDGSRVCLARA